MITENNNNTEMNNNLEKSSKFVITKQAISDLLEEGLTVDEMANYFTEKSGHKVTPSRFREWAKHFKINLRRKPLASPFKLEKVDEEGNPISNEVEIKEEEPQIIGEGPEYNII